MTRKRKHLHDYVYYRNTKDRCAYETEADQIDAMADALDAMTFDQFATLCAYEEVARDLGYSEVFSDTLGEDWSVDFSMGEFDGVPCCVMHHTECDFIFLRPADAEQRWVRSRAMSDDEWRRCTAFGKGGVDPR